ncbi:type III restriction-modification system endonuclease [Deinococcus aestuarii]|uniref:type III restriction-modification system endonuclease n=1 Tax=Deinococcus aestuarii TaxID=2774531 RepID=UPI001C0E2336|nr:DEAD/DEAH box helicase family protein [Deinococcus aestuarii]
MKIQFESTLDFQAQAIEAVADLFSGQQIDRTQFTVTAGTRGNQGTLGLVETDLGVGNRLALLPDELQANLNAVQLRNGLAPSAPPLGGDFTIEMETGTGKTYVYLRTAFELNRRYGFTKFVIVVPSLAIKEGVLKTLEMTREHFQSLYPEARGYDFYTYDSSRLGQVRDFATSHHLRFMVATIQSLYSVQDAAEEGEGVPTGGRGRKRAERVIHRPNEQTGGEKPIDLLRATLPVVIVDEPQSVDGGEEGKGKQALGLLNPLCTLRYSATHLNKAQMLYRLDAVDAYERRLVKGIEVASLQVSSGHNKPYVRVLEVRPGRARTAPSAVLELDVKEGGRVRRKHVTVLSGFDLEQETERELYRGMRVGEIRAAKKEKLVELQLPGDTKWLEEGQEFGGVNEDDLVRAMIARTIEEHLDKELRLRPRGLKVLSLFFIDRVDNYRLYAEDGTPQRGKYAEMFEQEYKRLAGLPKYHALFEGVDLTQAASAVHDGYFSVDKRRVGGKTVETYKDTSGSTAADEDAYHLIMQAKEKLLDLNTPLKFIFSHSALREGWDNPNIFQICVLREMSTERQRRQTIGRGLRLAVNQQGERVRDDGVNVLTVVATESYEAFAEGLQKEIEQDTGIRFGVVEAHVFAGLSVAGSDGQPEPLGFERSQALHAHLRAAGYVGRDGRIQDTLRNDLRAGTVRLPPEFEAVRAGVEATLTKLAGKLEIKNADERVTVRTRRAVLDSPEFQALWERICAKTSYSVDFSTAELIRTCTAALAEMPPVPRTQVQTMVAAIGIDKGGVTATLSQTHAPTALREADIVLPDLLGVLQDRTQLTRRTLAEIVRGSGRLNDFQRNPQAFLEAAAEAINTRKRALLVSGVKYEKTGDWYAQELLDQEISAYLKNTLAATKSVYDRVIYDSPNIERGFAEDLERNSAVKVYAKLPDWFRVPTPLGDYNPDWAVVLEENSVERLYFVVETKGTLFAEALRPTEQGKIACAKEHFAAVADAESGNAQYVQATTLQDVFDAR